MLIYLDIETTRFFSDPEIARLPRGKQIPALAAYFGVAVTYSATGGWQTWWPHDVRRLWRVLTDQQIAGWNVITFDMPLLAQAAALAGAPDPGLDFYAVLDLFAEIRTRTGRWYKLEEIAVANLGRGKLGDGQQAAEWLRSGDDTLRQRAVAYCKEDVQLVIELHQVAQTVGLVLPPRAKDNDQERYRSWISADGGAWRLSDSTGRVLDIEGWSE